MYVCMHVCIKANVYLHVSKKLCIAVTVDAIKITFLNHVGTGLQPVHTSFLEIEFDGSVGVSVPMCPPLRQVVTSSLTWILYRIMQIVRGGKLSRLHDLIVIRGKTFAIVQQFETLYNRRKKIC